MDLKIIIALYIYFIATSSANNNYEFNWYNTFVCPDTSQ